ncbi:hypothetical protein T01_1245 [Trichinella spiralis]|uniref:Uncharacterized protein n=1 Tax=Trichinella spiralis TaxID=6334 RepID=A0A0V1AHN4_TRISP|nr:hypothetical protein T01_1245 [Trichinella spiralis]
MELFRTGTDVEAIRLVFRSSRLWIPAVIETEMLEMYGDGLATSCDRMEDAQTLVCHISSRFHDEDHGFYNDEMCLL